MDEVLSQLMPSEGGGKRVKVLPVGESKPWVVPAADRHWLPSMERWLPGSWACTPIADKAVKEDGADINFAHGTLGFNWCCHGAVDDKLRVWKLLAYGDGVAI